MNLNFGYFALYGMYISITKVGMILMCIFVIMIFVSFMLY
jgi:hypothetical protein